MYFWCLFFRAEVLFIFRLIRFTIHSSKLPIGSEIFNTLGQNFNCLRTYVRKNAFGAFIDFKQVSDLYCKMVCEVNFQSAASVRDKCLKYWYIKDYFFFCNIGVRQGENLSPFSFSLYMLMILKIFLLII